MSTLISGLNPEYSANAAVLTGNLNRVTVMVEDRIDVAFWKDLLTSVCPEKDFHFSPYQTTLAGESSKKNGNGKSQIMLNAKDFNKNHIGCVDSDYDWLLSDKTDYGRTLCSNKYLLQTYAYSIENLLCFESTLKDFFSEIVEENIAVDFEGYLRSLSQILYPLLVWSVYLCSKGGCEFALSLLSETLVKGKCKAKLSEIGVEQLSQEFESLLSEIRIRVDQTIRKLETDYVYELSEKDELENLLRQNKGVTLDNANLYVRGHDLLDHLVNAVVTPTVEFFRQNHYKKLQKLDEADRIKALNKYNAKQDSVSKLIYKNFGYKRNSEIYNRIARDASQIWA